MQSRRAFLRRGLGAAGVVAGAPLIRKLASATPAGPNLSSVRHVVVFMQENRSFDHYLGTLGGVRGYGDAHPLRQPDGSSVFGQKTSGGTAFYPFRLNAATTSGQCVPDVRHDWTSSLGAVAGGRMNAWVPQKGLNTMSYHARADLPYLYALADAFTVCDAYHCSFNGSTNPNRLFLMTGTNDPRGLGGGPIVDNREPGFTWTTYPERLQAAGVTWRVYQETDNLDDNALAWFSQFRAAPTSSPLYQNGMQRFPRSQFTSDVQNGTLPAVSWIISPGPFAEHPATSAPNQGINYGALNFLNALAANPTVWAQTVFLWTYDENGGFFDHVVPPTPPPGTPDEFVTGNPVGLGARVPMLVLSPWSRGGWVCGETFDHTSVIRFLETWTGVREPNISAWRRKVCGDLTSAFDFGDTAASFPSLPDSQGPADQAATNCSTKPAAGPAGETAPPVQESGVRSLRGVPYQLGASLQIALSSRQLQLIVSNGGAQAATAHAHHFFVTDAAPIHLTVGAAASELRSLPVAANNAYDLELHGPNGFWRRWTGSIASAEPEATVALDAASAVVRITVQNPTGGAVTITVTTPMSALANQQQSFTVAAGQAQTVMLRTSANWYDYALANAAGGDWSRKLAGHIEGTPSTTRPL